MLFQSLDPSMIRNVFLSYVKTARRHYQVSKKEMMMIFEVCRKRLAVAL